ncbi:hypothetical protein SAMN02745146_2608 [Hymenobacter daecheongensis DSM 21074]|uniref:Uncharacterized protein n=1 Tax=Hymenobacter daecheongensis DSM 21074 TaxID=1121955 RepID=A0A1M6HRP4_9BACT|nr:hypothetical protein [Hymenobacter daecheongensis]SHJ24845.1 hypothetical protein SAMN02745146_2608 [Hymenobacter daecheongensis DSM 21074]
MEKIQTLLIILLGLGAFVWRMVQKARETAAQESRERPTGKVPPLPNTSFQELLKQMQRQNETGRQQEEVPSPQPAAEALPYSSEEPFQPSIRRAIPAVEPLARPAERPRVSLQPLPETNRRHVTEMLRTPADIRTAFVLSEILKRKFD